MRVSMPLLGGRFPEWLQELQPGYVCICDPYLENLDDLDAVRVAASAVGDVRIEVLVGGGFQKFVERSGYTERDLAEALGQRWGVNSVPYFKVVSATMAGTANSPVHDRWWITDKGVIEMGTSFSGLGIERVSKIRLVETEQAGEDVGVVAELISGSKRQHRGSWISYAVYTIVPPARYLGNPPGK